MSIVISFGLFQSILAPSFSNISHDIFTSLILGKLSIVQIPFINKVAGSIATAAFLLHLLLHHPLDECFLFIINFSKVITPKNPIYNINSYNL